MPVPALHALGAVVATRLVAGGDVNQALRVELAGGRALFVKHGVPGLYAAEAAGLRWLAEGPLPVPEVVHVADDFLALEWVESGARAPDFDARFGRGLAELHALGAPRFGRDGPTFIGPVEMPDAPCETWAAFYGTQRLAPLLPRAGLSAAGRARVERVVERLDDLCGPAEPPARLHGDLWSGNVMVGPDGGPWLVDPACYGGHREVDLAMLALFGSPSPAFFAAYEEVAPLADGWEDRVALHQLLPLLVHAVLFGGGYAAAVERAAARYA